MEKVQQGLRPGTVRRGRGSWRRFQSGTLVPQQALHARQADIELFGKLPDGRAVEAARNQVAQITLTQPICDPPRTGSTPRTHTVIHVRTPDARGPYTLHRPDQVKQDVTAVRVSYKKVHQNFAVGHSGGRGCRGGHLWLPRFASRRWSVWTGAVLTGDAPCPRYPGYAQVVSAARDGFRKLVERLPDAEVLAVFAEVRRHLAPKPWPSTFFGAAGRGGAS